MEKLLVFSLLFGLFASSVSATNVQAIFTFGDSIFDAGNNPFVPNCTVQADFAPYGSTFFGRPTGRFTNGRTVVDFISEFIGIQMQKPFLQAEQEVRNKVQNTYPRNGINFASAGSGVLSQTNQDMKVITLQDQVQQFETLVKQNNISKQLLEKSLVLFESGSNDLYNFFLGPPGLNPDAYVKDMLAEVQILVDRLYKLGARRIALFSLGPVGCVPAQILLPGATADTCYEKLNGMVRIYNKGLDSLVKTIPATYPGATGVYGNVYDLIEIYRIAPRHYGISDAVSACCGAGANNGQVQCGMKGFTVCPRPNKFMFWDWFHPSEHTYRMISKSLWSGKNQIKPMNLRTLANLAPRR